MKTATMIVALAAASVAAPAAAQLAPMKIQQVHKQQLKGKARVAVPSYGINFIVAQKANANAALDAQSELRQALIGVDEATMRKLADEAHADLKVQLTAAGIPVASDDEARGVLTAANAELRPGNIEDKKVGGGITFGKKKVRKGYITVGAQKAPLTTLFQASGGTSPFAMLGGIGGKMKLYAPAEAIDSLLVFPLMTVDFADTELGTGNTFTGARRSWIDSEVKFIIRGESRVDTALPMLKGRGGSPGFFTLGKDYVSNAPFTFGATERSAIATGERKIGFNTIAADSKDESGGARVDLPKYVALVQEGYRAYNAAIVAALLSTRG